ncbi:MAG: hypothetical protein K2J39_01250 [Ruminococcus sp.]|nr:hypothetical protein [Ruminococcus sp.]
MDIVPYNENINQNKKYYLVDFHSVHTNGLDGIEELSAEDNLIIFFSKSDDNVSFSVLSKLYSCKAEITMKEVESNDLINPVILVFLGSIINEDADIHLICKDSGNFIKATEIAIGKEINISVQKNISGIEPTPPPAPENIEDAIKPFELSEEKKQTLYDFIESAREQYPDNPEYRSRNVYNKMKGWAYRNNIKDAIRPYI